MPARKVAEVEQFFFLDFFPNVQWLQVELAAHGGETSTEEEEEEEGGEPKPCGPRDSAGPVVGVRILLAYGCRKDCLQVCQKGKNLTQYVVPFFGWMQLTYLLRRTRRSLTAIHALKPKLFCNMKEAYVLFHYMFCLREMKAIKKTNYSFHELLWRCEHDSIRCCKRDKQKQTSVTERLGDGGRRPLQQEEGEGGGAPSAGGGGGRGGGGLIPSHLRPLRGPERGQQQQQHQGQQQQDRDDLVREAPQGKARRTAREEEGDRVRQMRIENRLLVTLLLIST